MTEPIVILGTTFEPVLFWWLALLTIWMLMLSVLVLVELRKF